MIKLISVLIFILFITGNGLSSERYVLEADTISGKDGESFEASGNVKFFFKNTVITADRAVYYVNEKIIEATGNVSLKDDIQSVTAESVIYSITTEDGYIDNVTGTINGEYFICARSMQKKGRDRYILNGLVITTCDGEVPDWSFEFYRAEGEVEGYLNGDHATANIKNFPVLYSPKLIFPLKTVRQTGLLIPSFGYSTDNGLYFNESFFYALDYDKDITLGTTYFTEKGSMGLGEFRYAIANDSRIYFVADGINDTGNDLKNGGRWRYVSKSILNYNNFELTLDTDHVSDYMYTRDFSDYSLYRNKNAENVFINYLSLKYKSDFGNIMLYSQLDYKFNDTAYGYRKSQLDQRPTLSIEKYGLSTPFVKIDYYLSGSSILYKNNGYNYDAQKTKTFAYNDYRRIYGKIKLYEQYDINYAVIKPYFTLHYNRWYDWNDNVNTGRKNSIAYLYRAGSGYERVMPEAGFKLNLNEIYRNYEYGKHGILNTIEYVYIQDMDQNGLPDHFANDRIKSKNRLTFTMNNYFSATDWSMSLKAKQPLNLGMVHVMEPLEVNFDINTPYVSNHNNTKFDYYSKNTGRTLILLENNFMIKYMGKSLYTKYTYDSNQNLQYNTALETGVAGHFRRFDLSGKIIWKGKREKVSLSGLAPLETRVAFKWKDQCWNTEIGLSTEKYTVQKGSGLKWERNYKIELALELKGLGKSEFNVYKDLKEY